jgi:hypothetical protein
MIFELVKLFTSFDLVEIPELQRGTARSSAFLNLRREAMSNTFLLLLFKSAINFYNDLAMLFF